jgi:hypothetical protein
MMTMQSFFYWDQAPLADVTADDVLAGLVQPKRSLFYSRSYGAGISDYEAAPISLSMMVMLRYEAARFMAIRNGLVTDGNDGPDRRAATSQDLVTVQQDGAGLDVVVPYVMLADMAQPRAASITVGGTK